MTHRRGFVPKTDLTPEEKIRAAYLYECRGVAQQVLADVFGVNQGRINEALTAIRRAAGVPEESRNPYGEGDPAETDGT
jgi:transposase-like protein